MVVKLENMERTMVDCLPLCSIVCWHGRGGSFAFGVGFGASALEKQGRGQNATTLDGRSPIQQNWEDWGRIVAPISEL